MSTVAFTYTPSGRRASMVDGRGTTGYSYDSRDRLSELTYPGGSKLTYGWDANGSRTSLTAHVVGRVLPTTYTYDALNRLDTVTDPQNRLYRHGYDANGNRTSLVHPNGVQTTYTYDPLNRLKELRTQTNVGSVVQGYVYTLGAAGNRTKIEEADGSIRTYVYDSLYRLAGETVTKSGAQAYAKTFHYDPVGNRLQQLHTDAAGTATTTNGTFDSRDRQLTRGGQAWTWDANGNLTAKVDEAIYTWDFDDRLKRVTFRDGTVATETYDADGVRVRSEIETPDGISSIDYLVDTVGPLSQVVAETSSEGLSAYYVRGNNLLAVLRPAATDGTWTSRFYHSDGLGSVRALTDQEGTVTDTYAYSAFGELTQREGTDPNAYLFMSEQLDPKVGPYYLRARWMQAEQGLFLSSDPMRGLTSRATSLHRYVYAESDPVNRIDPSGFFSGSITESLTIQSASVELQATVMLNLAFLYFLGKDGEEPEPGSFFRGTSRVAENEAFDETGHILSDAALQGYFEGGHSLFQAYATGWATHQEWLREFGGDEMFYAELHTLGSSELETEFHRKKTLISVTKFYLKAAYFAGKGGRVYAAKLSLSELLPGYSGGTEGEFLLRVGRPGFLRVR